MKIFYIGKFLKPWATESYVAHALQERGAEVFKREYTETMTLSNLISQVEKHQPDFVLFSKVTSPVFKDFIDWCKASGILTVTWLWDLYWGYRPAAPVQFTADMLFTTDGGHEDRWETIGANHKVLRQGIHEPEHVIYPFNPSHNLAFVGLPDYYARRRELTRWLKRTYSSSIQWHNTTRGLALNRLLSETKIIVGDSYPSPKYWSNRVYEILGRGGFLLFPETEGLEEEFTDGVHYVSYKRGDYEHLRNRISYYLSHDDEREQIRQEGFKKCGEYTYTSRVRELLEHIGSHTDRLLHPQPLAGLPEF